jgi:uncharacterized OsmC-like protein
MKEGIVNKDSRIRDAHNRYAKIIEKQPQRALNTYTATAVIEDGFTCRFSQGEHSAVMDMPKILGGDDTGPTPGFFARAGIAGCVSVGVKQAAVMANLVFDTISVDIETDFDDGATLGLGKGNAAPLETRLVIRVETDIPESEVAILIERVLDHDPWFLALRDAQSVKTNVIVNQ